MKKVKLFLDKWIKFEIFDTETEGIYQIYAGTANKNQIEISTHGFNLYFGSNKSLTKNYDEYGFKSINTFKRAVVLSLYYLSRISAEEIVSEHIINTLRKDIPLEDTNPENYIWEGRSPDNPEKWSVFIDLRKLE